MIDTHNLIVDFGKHKGERWTRIPISYLRYLVNGSSGTNSSIAKAELARRGTTIPNTLELSSHSIDRASQITDIWEEKGVCSWLQKIGEQALEFAKGKDTISYKGFKFCFTYGNYYPILKTIIKEPK